MPDVFTIAKRSEVMSRIRSRGNKDTEIALARLLRQNKISGWRRHVEIRGKTALLRGPKMTAAQQPRPTLPMTRRHKPAFRVRPDFVFIQARLAIFVDGCFWHCCPKHNTQPKGNAAFWRRKLSRNAARDRLVTRTLRANGWRVLRIWEHALTRKNQARLVRRIQRMLQ